MNFEEFQGGEEGGYDPQLTFEGNAKHARHGLPIGMYNMGECDDAYILQVALPGIRYPGSKLDVHINRNGKVTVDGYIEDSKIFKDASSSPSLVLGTKVQELPLVGSFSLVYLLPGAVDPRLQQTTFGDNGILNIVVMKEMSKHKVEQADNNNY